MEIRTCSPEDLSRLDEAWPAPGKVHASHAAGQDSGDATYLVAWSGDEPIGSLVVQWTGPHGDNARAAFPRAVTLSHLQVRPEHRGAGVGSALIAAGETAAAARDRTVVTMGVGVDNADARRLYLRLGYAPSGVLDTYSYQWIDDDAVTHDETETSEELVKHLAVASTQASRP